MFVRISLAIAILPGMLTTGFAQQKIKDHPDTDHSIEKETPGHSNQKILDQLRESLQNFQGELEPGKLESILEKVEEGLANHPQGPFLFKFEKGMPPKLLKGHLQWNKEAGPLDMENTFPEIFQLKNAFGETGIEPVKRKMIGIQLQKKKDSGILVIRTIKGSAAEKAGLQAGDRITKVQDREIQEVDELIDAIQESEGAIKLTVLRKEKEMEFTVEPREVRHFGMRRVLMNQSPFDFPEPLFRKTKKDDQTGTSHLDGKSSVMNLRDRIAGQLDSAEKNVTDENADPSKYSPKETSGQIRELQSRIKSLQQKLQQLQKLEQ